MSADEPVESAENEDDGAVGQNVVMQPRCPRCKGEIWAMAVWEFSHGHARCGQCGYVSRAYFDRAEYAKELRREGR